MIPPRPGNHLRMHITTQAQLQAYLAAADLGLDGVGDVDDMAESVGLEGEQGPELVGGDRWDLGEVDGGFEGVGCFGLVEEGGEEGGVAEGGVAALRGG